jgi:hypothetical protein
MYLSVCTMSWSVWLATFVAAPTAWHDKQQCAKAAMILVGGHVPRYHNTCVPTHNQTRACRPTRMPMPTQAARPPVTMCLPAAAQCVWLFDWTKYQATFSNAMLCMLLYPQCMPAHHRIAMVNLQVRAAAAGHSICSLHVHAPVAHWCQQCCISSPPTWSMYRTGARSHLTPSVNACSSRLHMMTVAAQCCST